MIDIVEIKKAVKDGELEFYVNEKGNIFCKDIENGESVIVGYGSSLVKMIHQIVDKQNKKLGIE